MIVIMIEQFGAKVRLLLEF